MYVGPNIKQDLIENNEDHGFYNNNIKEGRDNINNNNNYNFLFSDTILPRLFNEMKKKKELISTFNFHRFYYLF